MNYLFQGLRIWKQTPEVFPKTVISNIVVWVPALPNIWFFSLYLGKVEKFVGKNTPYQKNMCQIPEKP